MAALLILVGCQDGSGTVGNAEKAPYRNVETFAPDGGNWADMVSHTAEGGFRVGNPQAEVRLVEYASMTCPHCAAFSNAASAPLREMISTGSLSLEIRSHLLNAADAGASLLVQCQPPSAFLSLVEQLYSTQEQWIGAISAAESQKISELPSDRRQIALMEAMELDTFFQRRGMSSMAFYECLDDEEALLRLVHSHDKGIRDHDVGGTPTFLINDQEVVGVTEWTELKPILIHHLSGASGHS